MGGGVLLRAIEPLEGIEEMMASAGGTTRLSDLGRGPGRMSRALGVDLNQDGCDLCAAGPLWLAATTQRSAKIGKAFVSASHARRIGCCGFTRWEAPT